MLPTPATLSLRSASTYSGLGRSFLYELIARGQIDAVKAGRRTLLTTSSLDRFLASLPPAKIGAAVRRAA